MKKFFIFGENPTCHTPEQVVVITSEYVFGEEAANRLLEVYEEKYCETMVSFYIAEVHSGKV